MKTELHINYIDINDFKSRKFYDEYLEYIKSKKDNQFVEFHNVLKAMDKFFDLKDEEKIKSEYDYFNNIFDESNNRYQMVNQFISKIVEYLIYKKIKLSKSPKKREVKPLLYQMH